MGTVEHLDGNPFAHSYVFMTCPNCGAQAQLVRAVKAPHLKSEARTYVCDSCHQQTDLIVAA
jgi:predicted RNA-binding Zn-ribbon protein involved in translation (DUF1610 family)